MDRQDQTETRDPDESSHGHGLRDALRRAAAGCRTGLRSDVVCRLKCHERQRALGLGKMEFYRSNTALDPVMDPAVDHLGLALWAYIKYSIICLMRILCGRSSARALVRSENQSAPSASQ